MRNRSEIGDALNYQQLENKSLLAGIVYVSAVGNDIAIKGDAADNHFEINLAASQPDQLVNAFDGTTVKLQSGIIGLDLSNIGSVLVKGNSGNDTIVVHGNSTSTNGDMQFELGKGADTLLLTGAPNRPIELGGDMTIFGHMGSDQVFLSEVNVGGDLDYRGAHGDDSFAQNELAVTGGASYFGQSGYDNFFFASSELLGPTEVIGGAENDLVACCNLRFASTVSADGQSGTDFNFFSDDTSFEDTFGSRSFEVELNETDDIARSQLILNRLSDALTETADDLAYHPANWIHDSMIGLANCLELPFAELSVDPDTQFVTMNDPTPTVSVIWDNAIQNAIVESSPGPTIASRAFGMVHTAMYDAWSAYDPTAVSTQLQDTLQRPASENTVNNKLQAMSYAAHRVLNNLFPGSAAEFDAVMEELGYDPSLVSVDQASPAGVGQAMADALIEFRQQDGSNQLGLHPNSNGNAYSDFTNYEPSNPIGNSFNIELWTPELVPIDEGPANQNFLTPHWGRVEAFSYDTIGEFRPDSPQPFLLVDGTVDLEAKTITTDDGTFEIDKSLIGTIINPEFVSQAEYVVDLSANLTDEQKLIAEFWEDGGGTSFPPGTFMTFGQFVSARDNNSLDKDAQMFFALGNAVMDAGIATWEAKVFYDYVRPVRAIRELGELGLIGEFDSNLGGYAIDAWVPDEGTQRILSTDFLTYQTPGSDPSPPFAEYTSGHSAFSSSAARVLELFTGSSEFNASVTFQPGESRFEPGVTPVEEVTLSWSTFAEAADEAGESRLYGGIHFTEGDINGRTLGQQVGDAVFAQTQAFINGTA